MEKGQVHGLGESSAVQGGASIGRLSALVSHVFFFFFAAFKRFVFLCTPIQSNLVFLTAYDRSCMVMYENYGYLHSERSRAFGGLAGKEALVRGIKKEQLHMTLGHKIVRDTSARAKKSLCTVKVGKKIIIN